MRGRAAVDDDERSEVCLADLELVKPLKTLVRPLWRDESCVAASSPDGGDMGSSEFGSALWPL